MALSPLTESNKKLGKYYNLFLLVQYECIYATETGKERLVHSSQNSLTMDKDEAHRKKGFIKL